MTFAKLPAIGTHRRGPAYDVILATLTCALAVFGALMIYSATRPALVHAGDSPHYYLTRQLGFIALGVVVMFAVSRIDYRHYEAIATPFYLCSMLGLILVKSPIGSVQQGAQRWFSLGPIQLQPSEFAVPAMILSIATYCERRPEGLTRRDVVRMLLLGAVPIFLVFIQPDLGTAIIMVIVLVVMLAIAGVPPRFLAVLGVVGGGVCTLAIVFGVLQHYQVVRLIGFLGQQGYQVTHGIDVIGSGGLWGSGFFHGLVTTGFVPEQQTDFIFSVVGEQLGFVGAIGLLCVMAVIASRMLRAAMLSKDHLGRLLAVGTFTFFAFSCFQNVGMNMGLMPVTGIPLPFMSYGGSAAIVFFLAVGVVLSVTNRKPMHASSS